MKSYCAYRERSHMEVRTKLIQLKIYGEDLEQVMGVLIEEDFLNEERFARAFVRGKFRQNKWGKIKIKQGLKKHKISSYCERKAFEEIEDEEYIEMIQTLFNKKLAALKGDKRENIQKAIKYLIGKGYEYEVVKEVANS